MSGRNDTSVRGTSVPRTFPAFSTNDADRTSACHAVCDCPKYVHTTLQSGNVETKTDRSGGTALCPALKHPATEFVVESDIHIAVRYFMHCDLHGITGGLRKYLNGRWRMT